MRWWYLPERDEMPYIWDILYPSDLSSLRVHPSISTALLIRLWWLRTLHSSTGSQDTWRCELIKSNHLNVYILYMYILYVYVYCIYIDKKNMQEQKWKASELAEAFTQDVSQSEIVVPAQRIDLETGGQSKVVLFKWSAGSFNERFQINIVQVLLLSKSEILTESVYVCTSWAPLLAELLLAKSIQNAELLSQQLEAGVSWWRKQPIGKSIWKNAVSSK